MKKTFANSVVGDSKNSTITSSGVVADFIAGSTLDRFYFVNGITSRLEQGPSPGSKKIIPKFKLDRLFGGK